MKALPWIIAGIGIGVGVTILMFSEQEPAYDTGYDSVEGAARKTFNWGTRKRAEGKAESVVGAIKEGIGNLTGDQDMADEGAAHRFVGDAKDVVGEVGHAAAQTIHDLNK